MSSIGWRGGIPPAREVSAEEKTPRGASSLGNSTFVRSPGARTRSPGPRRRASARLGSSRIWVTMGCCSSKAYAVEEPGAYEARRERMLQAAEERNAAAATRGIHNPRAAQKLREHQSAPQRDSYQSRRDAQMVSDWNS